MIFWKMFQTVVRINPLFHNFGPKMPQLIASDGHKKILGMISLSCAEILHTFGRIYGSKKLTGTGLIATTNP